MGTREVYDYKPQKWVPYVSDPEKWYQHLIDLRDGLVHPDHLGRYIVGSGAKYRHLRLKEMEAEQIEKQNRWSIWCQPSLRQRRWLGLRSNENVRWQKVRPLYLQDDVKTPTDRSRRITFNTKVPLYEQNSVTCSYPPTPVHRRTTPCSRT